MPHDLARSRLGHCRRAGATSLEAGRLWASFSLPASSPHNEPLTLISERSPTLYLSLVIWYLAAPGAVVRLGLRGPQGGERGDLALSGLSGASALPPDSPASKPPATADLQRLNWHFPPLSGWGKPPADSSEASASASPVANASPAGPIGPRKRAKFAGTPT